MKTDFTIRLATLPNCEAIAAIHVKAWQETYIEIVSKQSLENLSFDDRLQLRKTIMGKENHDCIHLVNVVPHTGDPSLRCLPPTGLG
ncbi:MAG: hypothetical protein A3F18_03390 [Legionellales bacterium RIFCSPHIGHO2_12_FULL_37_14]|nr:MAG: hypothetical protein A3F18_03390 [Legionellales bacterium RIFCSPHIGHO2_12_FULL_37_14]